MIYIHLAEDPQSDDFYVKTARNDKEAESLIVQGFEYVATTPDDVMLFKKRK